jgi:hypothetical protein
MSLRAGDRENPSAGHFDSGTFRRFGKFLILCSRQRDPKVNPALRNLKNQLRQSSLEFSGKLPHSHRHGRSRRFKTGFQMAFLKKGRNKKLEK